MNIEQILRHYNKGDTIVLFSNNNTYVISSKVTPVDMLLELLNTGLIIKGRIL